MGGAGGDFPSLTLEERIDLMRNTHKVVNGHGVDEVMSLNPTKDDIFIGRFAHDELDKKLSKQTLPIIWNKFDNLTIFLYFIL